MKEKSLDELINLTTKGDISANELEAIKSLIELIRYINMWDGIAFFMCLSVTAICIMGYFLVKGSK